MTLTKRPLIPYSLLVIHYSAYPQRPAHQEKCPGQWGRRQFWHPFDEGVLNFTVNSKHCIDLLKEKLVCQVYRNFAHNPLVPNRSAMQSSNLPAKAIAKPATRMKSFICKKLLMISSPRFNYFLSCQSLIAKMLFAKEQSKCSNSPFYFDSEKVDTFFLWETVWVYQSTCTM